MATSDCMMFWEINKGRVVYLFDKSSLISLQYIEHLHPGSKLEQARCFECSLYE